MSQSNRVVLDSPTAGTFGSDCSSSCTCQNGAACHHVTGLCTCAPGWTGSTCTQACPIGTYGNQCLDECECQNGAACDPVTGACNCTSGWQGKGHGLGSIVKFMMQWHRLRALGNVSTDTAVDYFPLLCGHMNTLNHTDTGDFWCCLIILKQVSTVSCLATTDGTAKTVPWHVFVTMEPGVITSRGCASAPTATWVRCANLHAIKEVWY